MDVDILFIRILAAGCFYGGAAGRYPSVSLDAEAIP